MAERFAGQVLADGRVTIPADVREQIGVERGDYVIVEVEDIDGER